MTFDRDKARVVLRERFTSPDMPLAHEDGLLDRLAECVTDDPRLLSTGDPGYDVMRDFWREKREAEAKLAAIAALCEHPDHDLLISAVDVREILGDTGPGVTLTREEATLAESWLRYILRVGGPVDEDDRILAARLEQEAGQ